MDMTKLVKVYTRIREERSKIKKEYEKKDDALKHQLEMLDAEILRTLAKNKVNSMTTDAGTFYRQEEILPQGADWNAFYDWVAENHAFDALERRVKKTFVKEYMEENDGKLPPGITVTKQFVARVRRS